MFVCGNTVPDIFKIFDNIFLWNDFYRAYSQGPCIELKVVSSCGVFNVKSKVSG